MILITRIVFMILILFFSTLASGAILDIPPNLYITQDDPLLKKMNILTLTGRTYNLRAESVHILEQMAENMPAPTSKILLLSDGIIDQTSGLARWVPESHLRTWYLPILLIKFPEDKDEPEKHLIWTDSADLSAAPMSGFVKADASYVKLNNTEEKPWHVVNPMHFTENTYDLILMRRGLCVCKGQAMVDPKSCGGLNTKTSPHFLLQVAHILNKNNSHAFAYLEGLDLDLDCGTGLTLAHAAVQNEAVKVALGLKGFIARAAIICSGDLESCKVNQGEQKYTGIVVMSHAALASAVKIEIEKKKH